MSERLVTFLVWALVGCSAGVLALRLWPSAPATTVPLAPAEQLVAPSLERLLGASGPASTSEPALAAPADSRFQLLGLVAARAPQRQEREGLALLAWDAEPARSVRVGQWLDGEWQLLKVEPTGVLLGRQGAAPIRLQLEPPAVATTGSLPSLALAPAMAPRVGAPMQPGGAFAPPLGGPAPLAVPPVNGPQPAPADGLPRRRNPVETLR